MRALTNHAPLLAVAASECSSKKASSFPTAWHSVCRRRADNAAASQQPLDGSPPCISDVCCHGYVSLRSPGCRRGAGDRLTACEGAQAMAQPKKSRPQQTLPEHPLVTALLAELQAIDDRRQCALRFHTLMHQRCPLEIPVQYERLFLHAPGRKEEKNHDHRRGTPQSRRRRVPQQRV